MVRHLIDAGYIVSEEAVRECSDRAANPPKYYNYYNSADECLRMTDLAITLDLLKSEMVCLHEPAASSL
jgi:hypothetical protein